MREEADDFVTLYKSLGCEWEDTLEHLAEDATNDSPKRHPYPSAVLLRELREKKILISAHFYHSNNQIEI